MARRGGAIGKIADDIIERFFKKRPLRARGGGGPPGGSAPSGPRSIAEIRRIGQGNPNNSQVIQQTDHVQVNSGGRVIGRDGQPITGSVKQNPALAHIPLDEWMRWPAWNRRT